MSVTISSENYTAAVEQAVNVVLLDVWAPWCQPCRIIEPMVAELEQTFAGRLTVAKLNADDEPDLTARLGVTGLPTLRLVRGGQVVFESRGVLEKAKLAEAITTALAGTAGAAA